MGCSFSNLRARAEFSGYTGAADGDVFYNDEADGTDDITGAPHLEAAPASTEWIGRDWSDRTLIGGDAQVTRYRKRRSGDRDHCCPC
jgi:hypothetical protein